MSKLSFNITCQAEQGTTIKFINNHYSSESLTMKQAIKEKIEFLQSLPNYRYCTASELKGLARQYVINDKHRRLIKLIK